MFLGFYPQTRFNAIQFFIWINCKPGRGANGYFLLVDDGTMDMPIIYSFISKDPPPCVTHEMTRPKT